MEKISLSQVGEKEQIFSSELTYQSPNGLITYYLQGNVPLRQLTNQNLRLFLDGEEVLNDWDLYFIFVWL